MRQTSQRLLPLRSFLVVPRSALMIKTQSAPEPASFAVACECGQVHEGLRRASAQRIVCKHCGSATFVLPKNAFPDLPTKRRRKRKRRTPKSASATLIESREFVLKHLWLPFSTGLRRTGTATVHKLRTAAGTVFASCRRAVTPFRTALLCGCALLVLTGWLAVRSLQRQSAESELITSAETGLEALARGDLIAAREALTRAAEAGRTLGLTTAKSRRVRQLAIETTALTRLSPRSLPDLLAEAAAERDRTMARDRIQGKGKKLQQDQPVAVLHQYHDYWLLADGPVSPRGNGQYELQLPLPIDDHVETLNVVFHFEDLKSALPEAEPLLMTGAIRQIRWLPAEDRWELDLQPAALWAYPETYGMLPLASSPPPEETVKRLAGQSELAELPVESVADTERTNTAG